MKNRKLRDLAWAAGVSVALLLVVKSLWLLPKIPIQVDGQSMEPTLEDGDFEFVDTRAVPERFSVVVIDLPLSKGGGVLVKRVVALPGEEVEIGEGVVSANGQELEELAGFQKERIAEQESARVLLGSDEYFVLGDNANHSRDSRSIGPVKSSWIRGVVLLD